MHIVQEILKKIVKSSNRKFTVLIQREPEGGFTGRCLELRGAISYGKNMRELRANMKDAISLILDVLEEKAKETNYYKKETIELSN